MFLIGSKVFYYHPDIKFIGSMDDFIGIELKKLKSLENNYKFDDRDELYMTKKEIFVKKINEYVDNHGVGEIKSVDELLTIAGLSDSKGNILPSDYCYNRTSKNMISNYEKSSHLFEMCEEGKYRILGENYKYTGNVVHKSKNSKVCVVGTWNDGVYIAK